MHHVKMYIQGVVKCSANKVGDVINEGIVIRIRNYPMLFGLLIHNAFSIVVYF
jgi:hypothetical protein